MRVLMIIALIVWFKASQHVAASIVDNYGLAGTLVACALLLRVGVLMDRQ